MTEDIYSFGMSHNPSRILTRTHTHTRRRTRNTFAFVIIDDDRCILTVNPFCFVPPVLFVLFVHTPFHQSLLRVLGPRCFPSQRCWKRATIHITPGINSIDDRRESRQPTHSYGNTSAALYSKIFENVSENDLSKDDFPGCESNMKRRWRPKRGFDNRRKLIIASFIIYIHI